MVVYLPANFCLPIQYRPPGRSNRSGRAQANDDIFEGLPVKQWGQSLAHVSLAPPKTEAQKVEDDKWGEPPMPRDYQLLQPWTQHLLRLARSGKVGTKRKPAGDPDSMDEERPEDDGGGEETKENLGERGFVATKWRQVPEALLEPEHKHFEFLAKRRKGLPSLYAPQAQTGAQVTMRKTKVQKISADGEVAVYEVLVPEGQTVEGEVAETTELAAITPVVAAPGTVIEGVGIANEEGVVVAEHLKPAAAPRRNRPPPKKKGGPGRGKKRVTFTNADGTTYTTVVPNATKIVPQPGQTVKHVAKGEEASADITAEQAAARSTEPPENGEPEEGEEGEGEGEGSDEGDDEGDDDDDREEGELSEEDAPTGGVTPVPQEKKASVEKDATPPAEDRAMTDAPPPNTTSPTTTQAPKMRDASSSPELPLAKTSHSRQSSLTQVPVLTEEADVASAPEMAASIPTPKLDAGTSTETSPIATEASKMRNASSSPELPLAKTSHSRQSSFTQVPVLTEEANVESATEVATLIAAPKPDADTSTETTEAMHDNMNATVPPQPTEPDSIVEEPDIATDSIETRETSAPPAPEAQKVEQADAEEDLLGSLEKSLEGDGGVQES